MTPEELNAYLEPFLREGALPGRIDLDEADCDQLVTWLFDIVLGFEAGMTASAEGDPRGIDLLFDTILAVQDDLEDLKIRVSASRGLLDLAEMLDERPD